MLVAKWSVLLDQAVESPSTLTCREVEYRFVRFDWTHPGTPCWRVSPEDHHRTHLPMAHHHEVRACIFGGHTPWMKSGEFYGEVIWDAEILIAPCTFSWKKLKIRDSHKVAKSGYSGIFPDGGALEHCFGSLDTILYFVEHLFFILSGHHLY